jgi:glycosyltransferase involved in cell wall biosynthesis
MNTREPLISVIIPCYNQAVYLDECLQSVLSQTYSNWECIIINDDSPDNTSEIVQKWLEKDKRFQYIHQKNQGVASARNAGIDRAKGTWILPLDADDKIGSEYLERAQKEMSPNVALVYAIGEYFGERTGVTAGEKYSYKALLRENCIFNSAFFRKKDWERTRGYDTKMANGLEDWEFWIHLLKNNTHEVVRLNYTGYFYRIKNNSRSANLNRKKADEAIRYITEKHRDAYENMFGSYFALINQIYHQDKKLQYYKQSKLHRMIDKILKIFYKISF